MAGTVNRKRILVVDDDTDFLESLQLILIRGDHNVLPATNGHDALSRYREFGPDIVFLDVKMPGIDGYETFLLLRKHDQDARIVFTSRYMVDDAKYGGAKAASLRGMINKPIEPDTMWKMIRKHAK